MSDLTGLESTSLTHRVVLLGMAELNGREETPANAGEVVRTCLDSLENVDGDVLGRLSEADAARALNELEAAGLVETVDFGDSTAVGKGRPAYVLPVDVDSLCETFEDDERLTALVSRIRAVSS